MNAPTFSDAAGITSTRPEPLRVLVLYEDFTAALKAKSVLLSLLKQTDLDEDCEMDWCRLDLLRVSTWRAEIATRAAAADIITLSAHGAFWPVEFQSWCASWMRPRTREPRALVVMLDETGGNSVASQRMILKFRVMAAKAGMALFMENAGDPLRAGSSRRETVAAH